jgi:hypothetical protein
MDESTPLPAGGQSPESSQCQDPTEDASQIAIAVGVDSPELPEISPLHARTHVPGAVKKEFIRRANIARAKLLRRSMSVGMGKIDVIQAEKMKSLERGRAVEHENWRLLIKHCVFLFIFTVWSAQHVKSSGAFWLTQGISSQAVEQEFRTEDAPTWGKSFQDVATVQELYQALHGPILNTYFSRTTWDGVSTLHSRSDPSQGNYSYGNGGFVLGFNKIIGSVRISQLRDHPHTCDLPKILKHDYADSFEWPCYRDHSKRFDMESEDFEPFGSFRNKQFLYDGIDQFGNPLNGSSACPRRERAKPWSSYMSLKLQR